MNRAPGNPHRLASALTVAAAALLATACAGAAPSGGTAGAGGTDDITVLHAPINYEAVYIAQQEGYFEEVGLNVEIKPGGTAQDNLGQLAGGSADLSIISWDVAVTATGEGLPIKVASGNAVVSGDFDTSGVVVRADSDIADMSQLEGKTIAFNSLGTGGNVPVLQALADAGVDPSAVTQVALPYASMEAALENSQVDAVFPADSFYAQVSDNPDYVVISNPSREYRGGLPITLWAATDQWLADNPGTAERFIEAMTKAIDFYSDPANVDAIYEIRSKVTGQPIEDVQSPLVEFDVVVDTEVSQATTDALAEFGLVSDPLPVDEILWEGAPRD